MPGSDNTTGGLSAGASETPPERTQLPLQAPLTEEQMRAAHVGEVTPLNGPVQIADYNPEWPRLFEREAERIRAVLGNRVLLLEHVGSTSVSGLAAKPRIDILLVVADSANESAYIPSLEVAAYVLHIREPDWHEHRLLKGPDTAINLHVFSPGCRRSTACCSSATGCATMSPTASSTSVPSGSLHVWTGSIHKTTPMLRLP